MIEEVFYCCTCCGKITKYEEFCAGLCPDCDEMLTYNSEVSDDHE